MNAHPIMLGQPKTYLFLLFLILVFFTANTNAQIKDVGLPFIVNHQRAAYNAGSQNWSIAQSSRGFMYFANNDGIVEYDGTNWNIYPVPNASVVRSVLAIGDTIYAGAFEEIGFLAPDQTGRLAWHSLNHMIPSAFIYFDEIWNIFHDGGRIIFQSFYYIFILEKNSIKVIEPTDVFGFMYRVDDQFYLIDREKGLMVLEDDSLSLVSDDPVFLKNEINALLPYRKNELLVGTSNKGIFIWDGEVVTPWESQVSGYMQQHDLYTAIKLSDRNYAFGSISNGIYIAGPDGNLLQHMNRLKGLQNNTVLALYEDRRKNLWMGLDNGIDFAEISSPLTIFNYNFNIETTYATVVHDGIIYVGTNQGLFAAQLANMHNWKDNREVFRLIEGTEGQVWSLKVINNTLFCGHNYGCFQIDGFDARQLSDIRGFWSFLIPPDRDDMIIAGTFTGLVKLEKSRGKWHFSGEIEGFRESSRDLYIDHRNDLWISHGYRGLFRLEMNDDFSKVENVRLYYNEAGLPPELPYNIQRLDGQMSITTREEIKTFDYQNDSFEADEAMNDLFANKGFIDKIHQDAGGNLWYFTDNQMGVMRRLEDGTYRDITSPFSRINDILMYAFQNIFVDPPNNVFIGTQDGLVHYDPGIINDYQRVENVCFTEISFYGKRPAVSYHTFSQDVLHNREFLPRFPHALNSVIFRFTTPVFENPSGIRFSYKLAGFDPDWSEWSELNFKEYTNLREGHYVFQVKALNAFGVESNVSTFQFTVEPPFLRSRTAYFIYVFLLVVIIGSNMYFVRKRILKIRQREKIRHEKRLARREQIFKEQTALSEKEIIQLRNESLTSEMQHKNKELANATMHLIQKNKTLTSLKNDLNRLLKNIPSDNPEKQNILTLLKKVNKELKNEKHQELFNSYFDEVHQDFITRLKDDYQNLSPKELRLCAYLRMNLSTKEIAPLMNVSVRGVEISRYRLRKKLGLEHDINLADFILSY